MQWGSTDKPSRMDPPVHHDNSMQSLLGYNEVYREWSDRNSTTYHIAMVLVMPLIWDQVTIKYATRLKMLARMLGDDLSPYRPRLVCLTNSVVLPATPVRHQQQGLRWPGPKGVLQDAEPAQVVAAVVEIPRLQRLIPEPAVDVMHTQEDVPLEHDLVKCWQLPAAGFPPTFALPSLSHLLLPL
jgi:hypothetical protein